MIDYQEELEQYQERIDELAKEKRYAELRDLFLPMEPADIALLLEEGKQEQMPLLYRLLPKELAAEVFVELESDSQEMLINGFSNTELKEVLDELYLDDAVDIVEEMPASVVIRILDKATPEMRKSTEIPGGQCRLHYEHGVPVPEKGHDGGGRLQAHPPYRR